jgi:sterol-4alpha-carboxylate 3-dehydrogenase (decarboxylating)
MAPTSIIAIAGDMLEGLGYARPHIKLPFLLILFVAMLFEYVIRPMVKPIKELSTDFTVFRVRIVTRQRAFSCEKAKMLLGYTPAVSLKQGIQRTVEHFVGLRNPAATAAAAHAGAKGSKSK